MLLESNDQGCLMTQQSVVAGHNGVLTVVVFGDSVFFLTCFKEL